MSTAAGSTRPDRAAETRQVIMAAAERLFAEHGLSAVSSRQIAEAAGQRNVTAVSYHFGSRPGLVRALMARHGEQVDVLRERHLRTAAGSTDVRDWVDCLVRPTSEHLAALGTPSWHARCAAQVMTDPTLRVLVIDEALTRPPLTRTLEGLHRCLAHLPSQVLAERGDMARQLIVHTCAERERALAEGTAPPHTSWERTAGSLTDALVGLFTAPVS
ncbi:MULTISPECIES: TetR/AcrR family transcriptional regulator [Streptomyces]|uniref:TetR family transcriptional regulator n=1 Tax=Streptomyces cacaoi TaxID=1898 RepID=A0A4Y3R6U1_STRCI|nr:MULTISPECIES: helix-turn-helix domain-containing protein [Streptomyces]NNG87731.1 helix-turn-helix transcriptional regulator [Streptomyces cacaoi]QHF96507.1 TetR/AcrR family transcriptional regulator [Streptomyces sp. NHF165]GEB52488.1 TetR family transcriptional regulator [Streptomyces cacaoi]